MNGPIPPPPSGPSAAVPARAGEGSEPTPGALPRVSWGPSRALIGLASLLLATLALALLVSAFDPELDSLAARLALQALLAGVLVAVAFLVAVPGSAVSGALLGLRRPRIPPWKPAALAYLAYILCAIAIAIVIQPEQEDVTEQLGYGEGSLANVVVALFVVVAAPITEELFFRGFMFAGLRRALPFGVAAATSAGVWGLFHFTGPGTWGVVIQLVAFGIALSWLYERTGSIWPPIAVHALNNGLAFALLTA